MVKRGRTPYATLPPLDRAVPRSESLRAEVMREFRAFGALVYDDTPSEPDRTRRLFIAGTLLS